MDINVNVPFGTTHTIIPRPMDYNQAPTFMRRVEITGETTSWHEWNIWIHEFKDWYVDQTFCASCYREGRVKETLMTIDEYYKHPHYIKLNSPVDATHYTPFTQQYYKEVNGSIFIYGLDISISPEYKWYHSNHNSTLGMVALDKL